MLTTNVVVNLDTDLKNQLQRIISQNGLSISDFFKMVAQQTVTEQKIPFDTLENANTDTVEAIEEAEFLSRHPEKATFYNNTDEMFEDILK